MSLVGFVGSRSLSPRFSSLVSRVVRSALSSGRSVAVGCASGADQFALSAALSALPSSGSSPWLRVFAAFGPGGLASAGRASAVPAVLSAAARVGSPGHGLASPVVVSWWAGGGPGVPLRSRLAARSSALVSSVAAEGSSAGLVAFVSGGPSASRGSWRSVRLAVSAGLPVVVFLCGCSASVLPPLWGGRWVAAGSGVWAGGWRWVPAGRQLSLFH